MSRSDAWMPLHIGDYLSDTMRLTTVQHGAYLLLLMQYWKSGPLADDEDELAGIARMDLRSWAKISAAIRRFFVIGEDGLLHQKRADAERTKAAAISQKRRDAVAQRTDRQSSSAQHLGVADGLNECSNGQHDDNKSVTNVTSLKARLNTHARTELQPQEVNQETEKDTVPSGTDADASKPPPTPKEQLWQDGLPILAKLLGKSASQCRAFLGKMLRDLGDDHADALRLLREAERRENFDGGAWLSKACQPKPKQTNGFYDLDFDRVQELMRQTREREESHRVKAD